MRNKLAALLVALCLLLTGFALGDEAVPADQAPASQESNAGETGEVGLTLTLENARQDSGQVWYTVLNPGGTLVFRVDASRGFDRWTITVTGAEEGTVTASGTGTISVYRLPQRSLTAGGHILQIDVYRSDRLCGSAELYFVLEEEGAEDPGEDPGSGEENPDDPGQGSGDHAGHSSWHGFSGKGRRSGSGSMGFTVTPGKALTGTHAKGSNSLDLYGTVALTAAGKPMDALVLGGEALDVTCEGTVFTAKVSKDTLVLTAQAEGRWSVSMDALETLSRSGVSTLVLAGGGPEQVLSTGMTLTGDSYARERAEGYVASDFHLVVEADAVWVQVEDRVYDLEELSLNTGGGDR